MKALNRKRADILEIHKQGLDALLDRLGVADTIRFLQIDHKGSGDYSKDRHKWLKDLTIEEIVADVEQGQKKAKPRPSRSRKVAAS